MDYDSILQKWINYIGYGQEYFFGLFDEKDFLANKNLDEYKNLIKYCNDNLNNSDCLYFIGFISYLNSNYDKALQLFNKAIDLGNSKAIVGLALIYRYADGHEENYGKVIELCNRAIKLGNSDAMACLAVMYKYGRGVEKDFNKAITLLNEAVNLGNVRAMNRLANIYMNGNEIKDHEKSIMLYNKAISHGDIFAMYNLAHMYASGKGIKQSYSKAIKLYNKSIKLHNNDVIQKLPFLGADKMKNIYSNNINYFIKKHIKLVKKCKDIKVKIENKKNYICQLENLPFGKEYYNALENFNRMLNKN